MANTVYLSPILQDTTFLDNNGDPLVGGIIHTYYSGTMIGANTYIDDLGDVLAGNPIYLDGNGRNDNVIWLLANTIYDIYVADANDITITSRLNVYGVDNQSNTVSSNALIIALEAYDTANAALALANAIILPAEMSYAKANAAANTVTVLANDGIIIVAGNINFQNTATVNVAVSANSTIEANVGFNVNTSSFGALTVLAVNTGTNGYITWGWSNGQVIYIEQWGQINFSSGGATVNFPITFPSHCDNIVCTREVSAGYDAPGFGIQYNGQTGFIGFVGSAINTVFFWRASGH